MALFLAIPFRFPLSSALRFVLTLTVPSQHTAASSLASVIHIPKGGASCLTGNESPGLEKSLSDSGTQIARLMER